MLAPISLFTFLVLAGPEATLAEVPPRAVAAALIEDVGARQLSVEAREPRAQIAAVLVRETRVPRSVTHTSSAHQSKGHGAAREALAPAATSLEVSPAPAPSDQQPVLEKDH